MEKVIEGAKDDMSRMVIHGDLRWILRVIYEWEKEGVWGYLQGERSYLQEMEGRGVIRGVERGGGQIYANPNLT